MNNYIVQILDFLLRHRDIQSVIPKLPKIASRKLPKQNAFKFSIKTKGELIDQLQQMGFKKDEIKDAMEWFLKLMAQQFDLRYNSLPQSSATRVFVDFEIEKIGRENCDFIMSLVNTNLLNSKTREIVITQLMEFPQKTCTNEDVKWVILMVLASQYNNEGMKDQMEKYALCLAQNYSRC